MPLRDQYPMLQVAFVIHGVEVDSSGQLSVSVDLSQSRDGQAKGFPVPIRKAVSHLGHGREEME